MKGRKRALRDAKSRAYGRRITKPEWQRDPIKERALRLLKRSHREHDAHGLKEDREQ